MGKWAKGSEKEDSRTYTSGEDSLTHQNKALLEDVHGVHPYCHMTIVMDAVLSCCGEAEETKSSRGCHWRGEVPTFVSDWTPFPLVSRSPSWGEGPRSTLVSTPSTLPP